MRKLLEALRLVEDGQVSLTAVLVWVAVIQVFRDGSVALVALAILAMTVKRAEHAYLREPSEGDRRLDQMQEELGQLRDKVQTLGVRVGLEPGKR